MLVLLKSGVSEAAAGEVATRLRMFGLAVHRTDADGQIRLGAVGDGVPVSWDEVRGWPGDRFGPAHPGALQAGEPRLPSSTR